MQPCFIRPNIYLNIKEGAMDANKFSVCLFYHGRLLQHWDGLSLSQARLIYRKLFDDNEVGVELFFDGVRFRYREAWMLMGIRFARRPFSYKRMFSDAEVI